MFVYLFALFLIAFGGAVTTAYAIHPLKARKIYCFLIFFMLALIAGLRGVHVGSDTSSYVKSYQEITYLTFSNTRYEKGYLLLLKAIYALTHSTNPRSLLIFSSFFFVGIVSLFIYRYSKIPAVSFLLYIALQDYFNGMNTMRQQFAVSITMIGMMILFSRNEEDTNTKRRIKLIISALLIILARYFHSSALVMFIPYIMIIREENAFSKGPVYVRDHIRRILSIAVFAFMIHSLVVKIATMVMPAYAGYLNSVWGDANYFGSALNTAIPLTLLLFCSKILGDQPLDRDEQNAMILCGFEIVFFVLSMRMEFWNRLAQYFSIYLYGLFVPDALSKIPNDYDRWGINTIIVIMAILSMLVVLLLRPEWTNVIPYTLGI